ncbi:hypothetical protein F5B20DRAFT_531577 [Whalleya microplaca]|nr:hypothetical protein F5B20DRAFT_531577 [Whalleya microplaca]
MAEAPGKPIHSSTSSDYTSYRQFRSATSRHYICDSYGRKSNRREITVFNHYSRGYDESLPEYNVSRVEQDSRRKRHLTSSSRRNQRAVCRPDDTHRAQWNSQDTEVEKAGRFHEQTWVGDPKIPSKIPGLETSSSLGPGREIPLTPVNDTGCPVRTHDNHNTNYSLLQVSSSISYSQSATSPTEKAPGIPPCTSMGGALRERGRKYGIVSPPRFNHAVPNFLFLDRRSISSASSKRGGSSLSYSTVPSRIFDISDPEQNLSYLHFIGRPSPPITNCTDSSRHWQSPPPVVSRLMGSSNPSSPLLLPCEFMWYTSCKETFKIDETAAWIEHIADFHLRDKFPGESMCWFCDDFRFSARKSGSSRSSFEDRMYHIRDHLVHDCMTVESIRPDFFFLDHLQEHKLIPATVYERAQSWSEAPYCPGIHPPEFIPPRKQQERERSLSLIVDHHKEDRIFRRKRLKRATDKVQNANSRSTARANRTSSPKRTYSNYVQGLLSSISALFHGHLPRISLTVVEMIHRFMTRMWWPRIPPGSVRVSWICRCGRPLYVDVPQQHAQEAVQFAQEASGSPESVQMSNATSDRSSNRSQYSQATATSGISSLVTSWGSQLPTTAAPPEALSHPPQLPPGTKKYLLLCVNTGPYQIKLSHIDLTYIANDETLYTKIRESYREMRGRLSRNAFVIPKTIEYIKFDLMQRRITGECVGNYQTNCIPSIKEVLDQQYVFFPCPPQTGTVPIAPHLFMHSFLRPGDHTGGLATMCLPKKVGRKLRFYKPASDTYTLPFGWGVYIVEGLNTKLVALVLISATLAAFLVASLWSGLRGDVQGGMGIGQFALAFVALIFTACIATQDSFRGVS